MKITFNRPVIDGTKALVIEQDGVNIGEMRRWFRPQNERPANSPIYDVNIIVESRQATYKITQQSFTLREGHSWILEENTNKVGEVVGAKGLFKRHQIELVSESYPHFNIVTTWGFKGNGIISMNNKEIGDTTTSGFVKNSKVLIDTEPIDSLIDPALLAGITYTYWSSFNKG
ncbi:hypothetical protein LGQ02_10220 [Bacillus shivajii]|uniref:hypothetical protein n=1 Tax=Bacillus shivajii TaxID=1983719 RepID=UPI001CFB9DAB|nr:hypothetical protein [Bacillus shivajii]UCZ55067.1 hypothetical protein LGQ02_10220 [Bacillus shivajii]